MMVMRRKLAWFRMRREIFTGTTSNGGSSYQEGQGTVYKIDTP